jgi:hypothetical protein
VTALDSSHARHTRRGFLSALISCLAFVTAVVGIIAPAHTATATESISSKLSISLTSATSIVTDKSGYTAKFVITNSSDTNLAEGSLLLFTSTRSFSSSQSMQDWANGTMHTPTPLQLGVVNLPALSHGKSTTATITLPADSTQLKSIRSWGAKPLYAEYDSTADGGTQNGVTVSTQLHSYLTRSHDGLSEHATPQLTITTALPFSSAQRTVKKDGLANLVKDAGASANVTAASDTDTKELTEEAQLAREHPSLRVVADPESIGTVAASGILKQSSLAGIMQPYGYDVTSRSAFAETLWEKAGIADSAWSASTAHTVAANSIATATSTAADDASDSSKSSALTTAKLPAIAWESDYSWDSASLALAAKQGYSTVVAESAERSAQSNVISGRKTVTTPNGTVTVLVAEQTLSSLAQGKATSDTASAEGTAGGRLARFVAQTALFQMQRPYVSRTLLVSFGDNPNITSASAILSALEDSDWVAQGTMKDLESDTVASTDDAASSDSLTPDVSADEADFTLTTRTPTTTQKDTSRTILTDLASTTTTINRLTSSVLRASDVEENKESDENTDPQALSRQNAKKDASDQVTALQWLAKLRSAHQDLGLMAFSATQSVRTAMKSADATLNTTILGAVRVIPPTQINVFSESAATPATIKNALPFPISIAVDATTDSNAISITKSKNVDVNAGSEAQATFTIHVVGTGSATATFAPTDRKGRTFGTSPSTVIYSQLTINDMSGNILIILALLLGAVGIYRQATRRKDPDQ